MVMIPISGTSAAAPRPVSKSPAAVLPADDQPDFSEIECPLSGELVSIKDADGLIDLYERLKAKNDAIYSAIVRCRQALADLTEGDAATRRVQGKRRRAKITMPDVSFEQAELKALWNSHPKLALEYLKISQIAVQMTPYKRLVNTSSPEPDFTYFRDALTKACKGRVGTPSVAVEL